MEYNSNLVLKNITYLLEDKGMGIGDFEANMGVSTGYITRTFKKEGASLNMEFITNVCNFFGISLDDLLFRDLSSSFPSETKTYSFIKKLIDDTWDSKLNWNYKTAQELNERVFPYEGDESCSHPMFTHISNERAGVINDKAIFVSHLFGENTKILDDCYYLEMSNKSTLYLMSIRSTYKIISDDAEDDTVINDTGLELWMVLKNGSRNFICDIKARNGIGKKLDELYTVIKSAANCPKTSDEVESIMDDFINKSDVVLPFEL